MARYTNVQSLEGRGANVNSFNISTKSKFYSQIMRRNDYLVLALTTVNVRLLNSKDITQMLKLLNNSLK